MSPEGQSRVGTSTNLNEALLNAIDYHIDDAVSALASLKQIRNSLQKESPNVRSTTQLIPKSVRNSPT